MREHGIMRLAVSYRKDTYANTLSGTLSEERITQDMSEYQSMHSDPANLITERGGETSFTDEIYYRYYAPRQAYLRMIGNAYSNNEIGATNILSVDLKNGADFYKSRQETIVERIKNNEELNDAEKIYWEEKSLSVEVPFDYGYVLGWARFGETAGMLIICILGICIAVAPIFAGEYQAGTDAIILSTSVWKKQDHCGKNPNRVSVWHNRFCCKCSTCADYTVADIRHGGGQSPNTNFLHKQPI